MAKITKCDICGHIGYGRNPEGFHEAYDYSKSTHYPCDYFDLCDKCYNEYSKVVDMCEKNCKEKIMTWFRAMKQKSRLEGDCINDISGN